MATFLSNTARLRRDDPTPEEMAAIIAAIELAWPRPQLAAEEEPPSAWRMSGRWWAKPVPARRDRPW